MQNEKTVVVDPLGSIGNNISDSIYNNFVRIDNFIISRTEKQMQYQFSNDCEFLSIMMATNLVRLYKFNYLNCGNILSTLPNNTGNKYDPEKLIITCFDKAIFSKKGGNFNYRIQTLEGVLKTINTSEKLYYSPDVTLNDIAKNVVDLGLHLIKHYQIKKEEERELLCDYYTREIFNEAIEESQLLLKNKKYIKQKLEKTKLLSNNTQLVRSLGIFITKNVEVYKRLESCIKATDVYKQLQINITEDNRMKSSIKLILINVLCGNNNDKSIEEEEKELEICRNLFTYTILDEKLLSNFIENLNKDLNIIDYKNYIYNRYEDQTKNIIDFDRKGSVPRYCYGLVNAIFHKINTLNIMDEQIFNESYKSLNENEKEELQNYIIEKSQDLTKLTKFILINENYKVFQHTPYEDFEMVIGQKKLFTKFIKGIKDIIENKNIIPLNILSKEQQLRENTYLFIKQQSPIIAPIIISGIILTLNINGMESNYKNAMLIGLLDGLKYNRELEDSLFDYLKNNEDIRQKIINDLNTLVNNDKSKVTQELFKRVKELMNARQKVIEYKGKQPLPIVYNY